jgi:hypothetical protein
LGKVSEKSMTGIARPIDRSKLLFSFDWGIGLRI